MPIRRFHGYRCSVPCVGVLLVTMSACTTTPTSPPPTTSVPAKSEPALTEQCQLLALSGLIGQVANATRTEQARIDSGSTQVRVIGPGQMVTQDFQSRRLNIHLDEHNVITKLSCG